MTTARDDERDQVLAAFGAEAEQLHHVAAQLDAQAWARPSPCVPWNAAELFAHIHIATGRVSAALAAPPPEHAEVTPAQYYRPDARYAPATNTDRVTVAQQHAATHADGAQLSADFARLWPKVRDACLVEPSGRVVRTRHGDAMLLTDFLLTRVVELALHGLDLAAALEREPWLTAPAGAAVERLLLGDSPPEAPRRLGWDRVTFLRKATGRAPRSAAEEEQARRLGLRWLTLG